MSFTYQLLRSQFGDDPLNQPRPLSGCDISAAKAMARELFVGALIEARQRNGCDVPLAIRVLDGHKEVYRWTYREEADRPERRTS
ncbi:hypothetical protein [Methylobacterium sp. WSM2598]|uniref:hypothetical protein n=1 Tax=Methylobacterium sp. WSM2598 TaxID=398261 RepID=UPI0012F6A5B2|nr:hypothetical protein [Methylobacterium sp. WSM2598]